MIAKVWKHLKRSLRATSSVKLRDRVKNETVKTALHVHTQLRHYQNQRAQVILVCGAKAYA